MARMRWAWAADGPTGTGVGAPAPAHVPLGSRCLLTHAGVFMAVRKSRARSSSFLFSRTAISKMCSLVYFRKNLENSIIAFSFVIFNKYCLIID